MSNRSDNEAGSTQNSRIIRVRDLPIYYDAKNDDIHRYIPRINDDQPKLTNNNNTNNWLYHSVSQIRQSIQQTWNENKELRLRIDRGIETGKAHTKTTIDYVRDDQTILPKVGVVTVAGLGGLLLGHKGGAIRKTFYSSVAVTVALSVCYPKQSANLFDEFCTRIKAQTKTLFETPSTTTTSININKDRILHTSKTNNESIVNAKGDYGQSTPADQHLYTTRGVTPLDSEKKI